MMIIREEDFMIKRNLKLNIYEGQFTQSIIFYGIILFIYKFSLNENLMGYLWIVFLFNSLLSLDGLYQKDYEDGTLDYINLSYENLEYFSIIKIFINWLSCQLPFIIYISIIPSNDSMYSMLLGLPSLSLIGALGSSLTLGLKNKGLIFSIINLPLYIPIFIFGLNNQIFILLKLFLIFLFLTPLITGWSLRLSFE